MQKFRSEVVASVIFRDRMTTAILLQTFQLSALRKEGSEEKEDALKGKAVVLVKDAGTRFCKEIPHVFLVFP